MTDETDLLKEISHKLSQLLVLIKLSNSKAITETKEEIKRDPVFCILLDLADGSLSSTQMKNKVIEQTRASQTTVERRIAELVEKGGLVAIRRGHEIYYENSGLFD